jgi:C4-dicarboxylate-specific signal transduction histidine kinase
MNWLRSNPLLALAGLALAIIVATLIITGFFKQHHEAVQANNNTQQTVGVQRERLQQNEETINAVQNAHDAVAAPSDDDLNRMRSRFDRSRRPANHP